MKQILYVFPRYLRNNEHDQLHADIETLMDSDPAIRSVIIEQLLRYKKGREAEKVALQAELGSIHTETITDSDGYRDDLDFGFELLVESHLHHLSAAVIAN